MDIGHAHISPFCFRRLCEQQLNGLYHFRDGMHPSPSRHRLVNEQGPIHAMVMKAGMKLEVGITLHYCPTMVKLSNNHLISNSFLII